MEQSWQCNQARFLGCRRRQSSPDRPCIRVRYLLAITSSHQDGGNPLKMLERKNNFDETYILGLISEFRHYI